ncbi:hypothetical protein [Psychrobacter sp. S1-30-MNA-CIBAN-0213]|uniref:hypothetical protein n=1 Tax=Psychrobacter sp. S1-30-MNA-CIBAN-0213 TaxID=3140456 RepID=UPI003328B5D3
MKDHENVNYGNENDVEFEESLDCNVVVTVEQKNTTDLNFNQLVTSKAEVIKMPAQPSNTNQEILNQANAYHFAQQYKFNTNLYFYDQKQNWKNLEDFYKTVERFNEDECKSLVFAHNMYTGDTTANIDLDMGVFKAILISIFKNQQYPIQYFHRLMQFKINNQLPDSSLKWIKDNLRCALYVAYLIQITLYNKSLVGGGELVAYILNYLKYEITHFNYIKINLPFYSYYDDTNNQLLIWRIERIKSDYFRNRTDREIAWFKSDDSSQIEWAYNYLSSEKRDYLILQGIFIPISLEDKHNLILASLDVLSNVDYTYEIFTKNIDTSDPTFDFVSIPVISFRAKIIENMKDAWVKFSASNKNEEQSEVKVYKKNKDQLDSIMKAKGITASNKAISQMIEDEYKRTFNKD